MDLTQHIRAVPDSPKPGILFRDVSPLLAHPKAFKWTIRELANRALHWDPDVIVGLDARGFIFGAAVAYELNLPFVMVRKKGKLHGDVVSVKYELEYGNDEFVILRDSVQPGMQAVVIDDLLATGGSAKAASDLVETLGGQVGGFAFVIELKGLGGRKTLGRPHRVVQSLISYEETKEAVPA